MRKEIFEADLQSKTFESTVSYVKSIYPTSNLSAQLNIRKALLEESCNNPTLLMFSSNKRIEKLREVEEARTGNQSFKSYILKEEKKRQSKSMPKTTISVSTSRSKMNVGAN